MSHKTEVVKIVNRTGLGTVDLLWVLQDIPGKASGMNHQEYFVWSNGKTLDIEYRISGGAMWFWLKWKDCDATTDGEATA